MNTTDHIVSSNTKFLSGNEAIAYGAWEAGVHVACAYPGTPSTEILENIALFKEVNAEWSTNEKVAFDVGYGAAIAGARALVAMKHVGVNVASDSLMVTPFSGVHGGFVLVSADDPGMHSSQNEQDNRFFAKFAKIPMLEPSDAQEAHDFTKKAFEMSERFDIPVMIRTTTRVNHTKCLVRLGEREAIEVKSYEPDPYKHVVPVYGKLLRNRVEDRVQELAVYSDENLFNKVEWRSTQLGVITSGISYQHTREVFPDASVFKIGMTWPLPKKMIMEFIASCEQVNVIEELEPFIEDEIRSWGISSIIGKEKVTRMGELSPEILREAFFGITPPKNFSDEKAIQPRPPIMCPGCPHSAVFETLRRLHAIVTGDIGCYTLGALPPHDSIHTTFCMGAGFGNAFGIVKAHPELRKRVVGVIGDSTFMHSGISPLLDAIFNKGITTFIIMDNSTTAMTGHQTHPGMSVTLQGEETQAIDYEALVRAMGVKWVKTIDPYEMPELRKVLKEAMESEELSVVITKHPCVLLPEEKNKPYKPFQIVPEMCTSCMLCFRIGCPALIRTDDVPYIDESRCNGCFLCGMLCNLDAIKSVDELDGVLQRER